MCDDAAESKRDQIKCCNANPADGVRGPFRGDEVSKQFLYPDEFIQFVTHEEVPLLWRTLAAVAVGRLEEPDDNRAKRRSSPPRRGPASRATSTSSTTSCWRWE
jgi:hypothetical protein